MAFIANHTFLFRGKRYHAGHIFPEGHTALLYRTQFIDEVPDTVKEEAPGTEQIEAPASPLSLPPDNVEPKLEGQENQNPITPEQTN